MIIIITITTGVSCVFMCLPHFKMLELWNKFGFFSELHCTFVNSNNSSVE